MRRRRIKKLSITAMFIALALLLHLIEGFFPPLIPVVPFAKLGLANIASMLALILVDAKSAAVVVITRCLLGGIFSGNIFSLMYSLPAGAMSVALMIICYKCFGKFLNIVVISVIGAMVHNISQMVIASLIYTNFSIISILAYTLIISIISGILIGLVVTFTLRRFKKLGIKGKLVI